MLPARSRGFTLLELLVALSIFALISVVAFTGLQSSLDSRERTTAQADRLIEIQKAFNFLRQDLEQVVARSVRDQLGDRNAQNAFEQTLDGIVFVRGGRDNPLGLPRSSMERIGYALQDNALVRSRWRALDQPSEPEIDELPLLEDVEELSFRFLAADKRWVEQWPPANVGETGSLLPLAVEVRLELADYGALNRIFLLPY